MNSFHYVDKKCPAPNLLLSENQVLGDSVVGFYRRFHARRSAPSGSIFGTHFWFDQFCNSPINQGFADKPFPLTTFFGRIKPDYLVGVG